MHRYSEKRRAFLSNSDIDFFRKLCNNYICKCLKMTILGIGVEKFGFQQSGVYFYFPAGIFSDICTDAEYPAKKRSYPAGKLCILQHRSIGNTENMGIYSFVSANSYCQLSAWQAD